MKKQSSITAEGIALVRAMEAEKPENTRICFDPYARYFCSSALMAVARFFIRIGYGRRRGPGVQEFLLVRTRYFDDYLGSCLENGLDQLVILGAGFDSRAYRFENQLQRTRVFEVDHPSTQQVKLERLKRIFGSVPAYVTYVPIDLETDRLDERLVASGYEARGKTLFLWEGVTYYLTPPAVDATLGFVAHHSGPGSTILFDYALASVIAGTWKRGEVTSMNRSARFTGERMIWGIPEGTVEAFLNARGLYPVQNATADFLKAQYLTGVNKDREIAPAYAIVAATVQPEVAQAPRAPQAIA